jgi:formylglycine-generating enzyme required for sulfatase activity
MINLRVNLLLLLLFVAPGLRAEGESMPKEIVANGVEFLHVPVGWFWYPIENKAWETAGLPGKPHIRDVRVWLDGFYIAKFKARASDFQRFLASSAEISREQYSEGAVEGCTVQRDASGSFVLMDPSRDMPATHLSWQLAKDFAAWMGFRLPNEAEWTKAARGTDKRMWPWGDEYPDDTLAGYNAPALECHPSPVDSFPKGRSPYGAFNMAGSAFEMVDNWYNEQWDLDLKDGMLNPKPPEKPSITPPHNAPMIIMHGGRWSSPANGITVHRRNLDRPDHPFICYGARFALDEAVVRTGLASGTVKVVTP